MNKHKIIVKNLSPLWIKIIGVLIFLATAYKIVTLTFFEVNPVTYIVLNTIAVAIWTGEVVVVIDFQNQTIGEGFSILGLTYLDKTKFSGVEKVFVNKVNSSEAFRHLTRTIDIHHQHYKAFLKTTDDDKVCIGVSTDKEKLIKHIRKHNLILKTDIFDNTLPEPSKI